MIRRVSSVGLALALLAGCGGHQHQAEQQKEPAVGTLILVPANGRDPEAEARVAQWIIDGGGQLGPPPAPPRGNQ